MTKNKTSVTALVTAATAFKRSRKSPNMTPLTRQVMTKSIHRAILEYQHTQSLHAVSPKSPLDLRMQQAIYRSRNRTPVKCLMKTEQQHLDKSLGNSQYTSTSMSSSSSAKTTTTTTTTVTTTVKNAQGNHSSRPSNTLETVYEQEKDAHSETSEHIESNNGQQLESRSDGPPSKCDPIVETPIPLSRRKCIDPEESQSFDNDIWYTPKESIQTDVTENIEVNFEFGNKLK